MVAKATKMPQFKGLDQMRIPTETKSYKAGRFPRNFRFENREIGHPTIAAAAEFFCRKEGGVKGRSRHGLCMEEAKRHP